MGPADWSLSHLSNPVFRPIFTGNRTSFFRVSHVFPRHFCWLVHEAGRGTVCAGRPAPVAAPHISIDRQRAGLFPHARQDAAGRTRTLRAYGPYRYGHPVRRTGMGARDFPSLSGSPSPAAPTPRAKARTRTAGKAPASAHLTRLELQAELNRQYESYRDAFILRIIKRSKHPEPGPGDLLHRPGRRLRTMHRAQRPALSRETGWQRKKAISRSSRPMASTRSSGRCRRSSCSMKACSRPRR